jgi:hypothetical protein
MRDLFCAISAVLRYRGYLPQPLTLARVLRWLKQFKRGDRIHIRRLLKHVLYLPEVTVKTVLVEQNAALMKRLIDAGLQPHQIIYIQVHDAGSSSPVMLNMLRDAAQLEQRGVTLLDSKNTLEINEKTNDFGEGALVYIDDFIGSGTQICEARDFAAQFVVGSFSEFVLTPCICEEGRQQLDDRGIEVFSGHVHLKVDRPLQAESVLFKESTKERLIEICDQIDNKIPLGYRHMATMVVLYRNSPDNIPVLFRGNPHQSPHVGIFPRTTDMPITP